MGRVVRLAAVRRLERMRRGRHVRDLAQRCIDAVGPGRAGILAGGNARREDVPPAERQLWSDVEAELERQLGFTWWWGEEAI